MYAILHIVRMLAGVEALLLWTDAVRCSGTRFWLDPAGSVQGPKGRLCLLAEL